MSTATAGKPAVLAVRPESIPVAMKARRQWVLWSLELRGEKWTKVPYQAPKPGKRPAKARSNDPSTWDSFESVLQVYLAGGFDGIGYVFAGDGEFGVDLDDCRDSETGVIAQWGQEIIDLLHTYGEVSPSGTGAKLIGLGAKTAAMIQSKKTAYKDGAVEIYDHIRFFTITGHRLDGVPETLEPRQEALEAVYGMVFPPKPEGGKKTVSEPATTGKSLDMTDEELLAVMFRAKNGAAVKALWEGNIEGYDSPSEADLALCNHLAFYTCNDKARIDKMFRASKLFRDKWERDDYRNWTIDKSMSGRDEFYSSPVRVNGFVTKATGGHILNGHAPATGTARSAHDIIREWLEEVYQPKFRRGVLLYSERLGREVKPSEIYPTSDIISRLAADPDAPRDRRGVIDVNGLPSFFRTWLPVAWGNLLKDHVEEQDNAEIVAPAEQEFISAIRRGLLTTVKLGHTYGQSRDRETHVESRPAVKWAVMFAGDGKWADVRGLQLWGRRDGDRHRVAFRAELFSQIHARDFANITPRKLSDLCILYGVARPVKVRGGNLRALELAPDFLDDLVLGIPDEGDPDARTDTGETHAGAHADRASVCPGEVVSDV